jgi:hypothetical protein
LDSIISDGTSNKYLIIEEKEDLGSKLLGLKTSWRAEGFHFTNGVYSGPLRKIAPTTLAATQYIADNNPDGIMVIAVNSDKSYRAILAQQGKSEEEIANEIKRAPEKKRAQNIAETVAHLKLKNPVIVVFYDEETPEELYKRLAEKNLPLKSIYKWGYGTRRGGPTIPGAQYFEKVFAFLLPNDEPPAAYNQTALGDNEGVNVLDLRKVVGPHGRPYLTPGEDNRVLFPVSQKLIDLGIGMGKAGRLAYDFVKVVSPIPGANEILRRVNFPFSGPQTRN